MKNWEVAREIFPLIDFSKMNRIFLKKWRLIWAFSLLALERGYFDD